MQESIQDLDIYFIQPLLFCIVPKYVSIGHIKYYYQWNSNYIFKYLIGLDVCNRIC